MHINLVNIWSYLLNIHIIVPVKKAHSHAFSIQPHRTSSLVVAVVFSSSSSSKAHGCSFLGLLHVSMLKVMVADSCYPTKTTLYEFMTFYRYSCMCKGFQKYFLLESFKIKNSSTSTKVFLSLPRSSPTWSLPDTKITQRTVLCLVSALALLDFSLPINDVESLCLSGVPVLLPHRWDWANWKCSLWFRALGVLWALWFR